MRAEIAFLHTNHKNIKGKQICIISAAPKPNPTKIGFLLLTSFFPKEKQATPSCWQTPRQSPAPRGYHPPESSGFLLLTSLFSKREVSYAVQLANSSSVASTLWVPSTRIKWFSLAYFSFFQKRSKLRCPVGKLLVGRQHPVGAVHQVLGALGVVHTELPVIVAHGDALLFHHGVGMGNGG